MSEFLNPIEVLDSLELREDMLVADFGCGSGGWIFPLAEKIKKGKIYAIDALPEVLSIIESRSKSEKLLNIQTILANLEDEKVPALSSGCLDLVLLTNILFAVSGKKKILEESVRVLKKGGKILVVDWKKDNPLTPEIERVPVEGVKELAKELDLTIEKEFAAGIYHWALVLVK